MSIVVPPQNQSELSVLLKAQSNPNSPEYHHWLTSEQLRTEFAPDPQDTASVSSWLRSDGLSPLVSGYDVRVSAPASSFESTFGTGSERYSLPDGHRGYIARSTPLVPSGLSSGQITSILGLNTTYEFSPGSPTGRQPMVPRPLLLRRLTDPTTTGSQHVQARATQQRPATTPSIKKGRITGLVRC